MPRRREVEFVIAGTRCVAKESFEAAMLPQIVRSGRRGRRRQQDLAYFACDAIVQRQLPGVRRFYLHFDARHGIGGRVWMNPQRDAHAASVTSPIASLKSAM